METQKQRNIFVRLIYYKNGQIGKDIYFGIAEAMASQWGNYVLQNIVL
ncbi:MAG: hypothetical protein ACPL2D_10640 [Ignavibacteria bacterium]